MVALKDPILPLQIALGVLLKADASLTAAPVSGRIFDHVPQNEVFPYIRLGDYVTTEWRTMSRPVGEILVSAHIFSEKKGNKEALTIKDDLDRLLGDITALTVDGFDFNFSLRQGTSTLLEPIRAGRIIRHTIVRYRMKLQQS